MLLHVSAAAHVDTASIGLIFNASSTVISFYILSFGAELVRRARAVLSRNSRSTCHPRLETMARYRAAGQSVAPLSEPRMLAVHPFRSSPRPVSLH